MCYVVMALPVVPCPPPLGLLIASTPPSSPAGLSCPPLVPSREPPNCQGAVRKLAFQLESFAKKAHRGAGLLYPPQLSLTPPQLPHPTIATPMLEFLGHTPCSNLTLSKGDLEVAPTMLVRLPFEDLGKLGALLP